MSLLKTNIAIFCVALGVGYWGFMLFANKPYKATSPIDVHPPQRVGFVVSTDYPVDVVVRSTLPDRLDSMHFDPGVTSAMTMHALFPGEYVVEIVARKPEPIANPFTPSQKSTVVLPKGSGIITAPQDWEPSGTATIPLAAEDRP